MENIAELVSQIQQAGGRTDFYGTQSAESIANLESTLAVTFPPSYRSFLREYGGGCGMSGIFNNVWDSRGVGTLLGDTLRARERYALSPRYLVVCVSPLGGIYCLDIEAADSRGELPIIQIAIGPAGTLTHHNRVANSFVEYLKDVLEIQLEVLLEENAEDDDEDTQAE